MIQDSWKPQKVLAIHDDIEDTWVSADVFAIIFGKTFIFLILGSIFVSLQSRKRRIDTRSEPDKIVSSIVDDMDNALGLATKTMGMFWF